MITIKTIVHELEQMPEELLVEIFEFIRSTKNKNLQLSNNTLLQQKKVLTASELLHSNLIGLWENRDDITDNLEYARQLREKAQRRDYDSLR